jgi:hypothetical protein
MATQTLHGHAVPQNILTQAAGFFAALARAFAMAKNAEARFEEIQALQALDDAELSRRGIARENIVRHVYADMLAD